MNEGGRRAAADQGGGSAPGREPARAAQTAGEDTRAAGGSGRLAEWLSAAGAPQAMTARIANALGDGAAEQVAADPWCVLEVPGIAPQAADALARVVVEDVAPGDPRRTRALISWLLRRAAAVGGHTVQGADTIAEALGTFGVTDPTGAIADAIEHGAALAFAEPVSLSEDAGEEEIEDFERLDAEDDDDPVSMLTSGRTLLAVERWAFAEQAAAEAAQRLAATPEPVESKLGPDSVDALVAAVVEHGLTLVTGASAQRVSDLAQSFPSAVLASPSAAGLRTLAAAGADAVDARLLAEDPAHVAAADVLVIADAQLLGLEAGATLLEATRDGAHVVLAGDPATLASGSPGLFFRDLLETEDPGFGGRLPRVELKQRPTGPLTALADAVRHGGLPPQELLQGPDGASKEVVIVPVRDVGEAVHRAVQVAADSIPRAFGLSGRQVQVVAVDADGGAGAAALNAALKSRFNPGPGVCGGFDAGDRVVVSAALAERGLFGGETGTVRTAKAGGLTVEWDAPHGERYLPEQATRRTEGAAAVVAAGVEAGAKTESAVGAGAEAALGREPGPDRESEPGAESAGTEAGTEPVPGMKSEAALTATAEPDLRAQSEATLEAGTEPVPGREAGPGAGPETSQGGRATGQADTFTVDQARALRHSWALTVAEAQAGRWPAVVAVFDGESAPKLSRALALGAITLATQHLTVVHGAGRALADAVEKIPDRPRRTRLKHALRD